MRKLILLANCCAMRRINHIRACCYWIGINFGMIVTVTGHLVMYYVFSCIFVNAAVGYGVSL